MKYNIIDKKDYILIDIFDEYEFDVFKKIISIIKTECDERQINKVVIDVNKVLNLFNSETERFDISEEMVNQLGYKIKLAAVAKKEDITYYGEKVARKRGANMSVFSNSDIALEWLLK